MEAAKVQNAALWGIHWFRRDLRIAGNPALHWNRRQNQGRVLGLFCFDSKFLSREDFSHNRFAFFLKSLRALREELRLAGGDLLVLDRLPLHTFPEILKCALGRGMALPSVSFNRDYEPFARDRDLKVTALLQKDFGVEVHTERDHLIIEPHEVTRDGQAYKVFTPYSRKWFDAFRTESVQARIQTARSGLFSLKWKDILGETHSAFVDALHAFESANSRNVTVPIPEAGSLAAFDCLKAFKRKLGDYDNARDFPAQNGTSRFSLYFKNGTLTPAQVVASLRLEKPTQFFKELIWREFYYSILWHFPNVENEAFNPKYRDIEWENDTSHFEAWKKGETGFPIVDAGMRQLATTGWMHNRVRMIVASFLTKDLLIDWRWGERFFMKTLLDGDLASNNGGWQWAASTGCDPQPYFRIFNPVLQSRKFDPQGDYIKAYVPELRGLSHREIHEPPVTRGYPRPIVNHAAQRMAALHLYKSIS